MGIDAATFEAAITKTQQQLMEFDPVLERLRQNINNQLAMLVWPLSENLKWAWDKLVNLVQWFRSDVEGMLRNARVPFIFDRYEDRWLKIGSDAGDSSSTIQNEVNINGKRVWGGLAGGAYQEGVKQQPIAMDGIADKANNLAEACTTIRNGGYGFYIGLGIAVVSGVAAIATAELVAPAIAALMIAIASYAGAVSTLLLETNAAAKSMSGNLGPDYAFPGNRWPPATTS